jgi:YggT family protein
MGDAGVGSFVLADAATSVQRFVSVFVAYVITSWIPGGASSTLERVRQFLYDVCEPYLRLFRRVIPPIGPLDLSPIIAVFSLYLLGQLANEVIERIL